MMLSPHTGVPVLGSGGPQVLCLETGARVTLCIGVGLVPGLLPQYMRGGQSPHVFLKKKRQEEKYL